MTIISWELQLEAIGQFNFGFHRNEEATYSPSQRLAGEKKLVEQPPLIIDRCIDFMVAHIKGCIGIVFGAILLKICKRIIQ